MEMTFYIDFQVNSDYFTDDNNRFVRILAVNEQMIGGIAFIKEKGAFIETNRFLIPIKDLSDAIDEYNEQLENFVDEFYEEGDMMEEDLTE